MAQAGEKRFNKNMTVWEALQVHPGAKELLESHGMTCTGCPVALSETLEQAAVSHGLDPDSLLVALNGLFA